jgi:hypothetical protein
MAITVNQISAALQTLEEIKKNLNSLNALLTQAQILAANGWVHNISMGTGLPPVNVTITSIQQQAMVAQYDTLKSTLASLYSTLP